MRNWENCRQGVRRASKNWSMILGNWSPLLTRFSPREHESSVTNDDRAVDLDGARGLASRKARSSRPSSAGEFQLGIANDEVDPWPMLVDGDGPNRMGGARVDPEDDQPDTLRVLGD